MADSSDDSDAGGSSTPWSDRCRVPGEHLTQVRAILQVQPLGLSQARSVSAPARMKMPDGRGKKRSLSPGRLRYSWPTISWVQVQLAKIAPTMPSRSRMSSWRRSNTPVASH
jgi:hypothetical protein